MIERCKLRWQVAPARLHVILTPRGCGRGRGPGRGRGRGPRRGHGVPTRRCRASSCASSSVTLPATPGTIRRASQPFTRGTMLPASMSSSTYTSSASPSPRALAALGSPSGSRKPPFPTAPGQPPSQIPSQPPSQPRPTSSSLQPQQVIKIPPWSSPKSSIAFPKGGHCSHHRVSEACELYLRTTKQKRNTLRAHRTPRLVA